MRSAAAGRAGGVHLCDTELCGAECVSRSKSGGPRRRVDAGQDSDGHGDTDSPGYRDGWHDGRLACDCGIANRCQRAKENSRHSPSADSSSDSMKNCAPTCFLVAPSGGSALPCTAEGESWPKQDSEAYCANVSGGRLGLFPVPLLIVRPDRGCADVK